jgi:RHS repeat-associated protein
LEGLDIEKSRDFGSAGDPVLLADGSFDLVQRDLSFPGPARPLEFIRTYNSRSNDKSTLGSNWTHNWDVWLEPLSRTNTPTWAMPYCLGTESGLLPRFSAATPNSESQITCLLLHRGDASTQLFFLDLGTRLYMPQAGYTDTLTTTSDGGWAVRSKDGHIWLFNREGYLIQDRDRFGNGFSVDYEPTLLWRMYTTYCTPELLAQRNETKHARRCAFIAHMVGDGPTVGDRSGWTLQQSDYPINQNTANPQLIQYARAYLLELASRGADAMPPYGTRRLRPTRVTDDLGRSFVFAYTQAPITLLNPAAYDFAGTPQVELLESVTGPGGTTILFRYEAPQVPSELGERFLTMIIRGDTSGPTDDIVPAHPRLFTYYYPWSSGRAAFADDFADKVYSKYRDFYATFVGCSLTPLSICGERGRPQISPGNADHLAKLAQYDYISNVIDNIVRVDETQEPPVVFNRPPPPRIQSETRYEIDPWSTSFDQVYAQRYGSRLAEQDLSLIAPDRNDDNWQSRLPKATFSYVDADKTATLPQEIRARYPLEDSSSAQEISIIPPADGDVRPSGARACNYKSMESLRTELPGWKKAVPYFDPTVMHPQIGGRLFSTPLSCDQLSVATYGDPTHNDLMSSLEPIRSTPQLSDHIVRRLVGRRKITAANGNRICSWTQMTDRDGIDHYYGLNFRGQILVNAVREKSGSGFIFTETLYNADGMVTQKRRPVRGPRLWQPTDGYTLLKYDEIDPTGNRRWNEWLPVFWARRMNLLRSEEHPESGEVLSFDETTKTFATTNGRYQRFDYEPLFNQLMRVERGSLELQRAIGPIPSGRTFLIDVPYEKTTYIFDYQEMAAGAGTPPDRSLDPMLQQLSPWGYRWARLPSGGFNYAEITSWQLPIKFYGEDLNGDGAFGFEADKRGRGVPVMALHEGNDPGAGKRVNVFIWAPHGRPAAIKGSDGELVRFEYYSRSSGTPVGSMYGGTTQPTGSTINSGYAGFLGRVRTLRFHQYRKPGPQLAPCLLLPGPYQWLLPASCANPQQELTQLGLPQQAVQAILAASRAAQTESDPERYETQSFSYNSLGGMRYQWSEAHPTNFVRDTDGREIKVTNPLGTTIENTFTVHGFPKATIIKDVNGKVLSEEIRDFDENGAVIYTCAAETQGGCFSTPRAGSEHSYTYWPEGALRESTDPEGLVSTYAYNERNLLISENHTHPTFPREPAVKKTYSYNVDGDVESMVYAPGTAIQLTEKFVYDGLQRVKSFVDTRGFAWQTAFTRRDQLSHLKRSNRSYGARGSDIPSLETVFEYNGFGERFRTSQNGIETLNLKRTLGGHIYAQKPIGLGESLMTFDQTGRPAWVRNPDGTETVYTRRTNASEETVTTIRRSSNLRLTTSNIVTLDAMQQPTAQVEYGQGDQRRTKWVRDGMGRATEEENAEGFVTKYQYDLLGLLRKVEQQRTAGSNPQFETATYTYDRRGQPKVVTDPSNQITNIEYDSFGRLKERRSPGQKQVRHAFTYDALGRVDVETIGDNQIRHVYDTLGDPVNDLLIGTGRPQSITRREYDDLGRLTRSRNMNPMVNRVPLSLRTVERELSYDSLGRINTDLLRVGGQSAHQITSNWSLLPSGSWERKLSYAIGSSKKDWLEDYDQALRLAKKRELINGAAGTSMDFLWLGEIYLGRDQKQSGIQNPFRVRISLDHFGAPVGWRYTAIDLDARQRPLNSQDGDTYCGGAWKVNECARPLLALDTLRDVMGRVVSQSFSFGHPTFTNGKLTSRTPPRPSRGYAYDPMGRLGHIWEHAGLGASVSTAGLSNHTVTTADIQRINTRSDHWIYDREPAVGGTLSIRNSATNARRWSLPISRGPGHQIKQLQIDGQRRELEHNEAGENIVNGDWQYSFDPRGQLATVSRNGTVIESYLYDAHGRLAAVIRGQARTANQVFAYDGLQMVASFGIGNRPLWEASWGPGVDHLVSWRDNASSNQEYIPLIDNRNTIVAAWNSDTSRLIQTANYDPEGRVELRNPDDTPVCRERGTGRICPHPAKMPFGFTSAWRSSETGLVYMRNRWYASELGQFIAQDPLGFTDSYNLYAYAGFDSINRSDPLGTSSRSFTSSGGKDGNSNSAPTTFERDPVAGYNEVDLVTSDPSEWKTYHEAIVVPPAVSLPGSSPPPLITALGHKVCCAKNYEGFQEILHRLAYETAPDTPANRRLELQQYGMEGMWEKNSFGFKGSAIALGIAYDVAGARAAAGLLGRVGSIGGATARTEAQLVHLTDQAGLAGISKPGASIEGPRGIFAVPAQVARESTALKVLRTGLPPSKTAVSIPIPPSAAGLFQRPLPIGPYSAWKYLGGVRFAPPGGINAVSGAFTPSASLVGPRVLIYGPDVLFYSYGAAGFGLYQSGKSSSGNSQ